ncbi:hypothetical protein GOP47_0011126 [Adiantum capillus-veneris]|uniref:Uncharacterized protein n=1 Tax=Adiantum capillus-veneris TaxID=13818 RepID=A0A9D4UTK8_ADICA|nr:hypothetical protein GOP47_0011126 [Adiantum capillus-veneris]
MHIFFVNLRNSQQLSSECEFQLQRISRVQDSRRKEHARHAKYINHESDQLVIGLEDSSKCHCINLTCKGDFSSGYQQYADMLEKNVHKRHDHQVFHFRIPKVFLNPYVKIFCSILRIGFRNLLFTATARPAISLANGSEVVVTIWALQWRILPIVFDTVSSKAARQH